MSSSANQEKGASTSSSSVKAPKPNNSHQDEATKLRERVIELQQELIDQLLAEKAKMKKKYADDIAALEQMLVQIHAKLSKLR